MRIKASQSLSMVYTQLTENCTFPEFVVRLDEELKEAGKSLVSERPSWVLIAVCEGLKYGEYDGHDYREVPKFSFQQMIQAIKALKEEELDSLIELMELNHYAHSCLNDCCRFDAVGWLADVGRDSRDYTSDTFVQILWDFLTYDQQRWIVCSFLEGVIGLDNVPVERVETLFNILTPVQKKDVVANLNDDEVSSKMNFY